MTYHTKKQVWKNILRNAVILGGISGASQMLTTQDFSYAGLMTGLMTAALVALIEMKHAYKITPFPKFKGSINNTFFLA